MSTFLANLGRFSARHRVVVVIAWVALFFSLTGILAANRILSRCGASTETVRCVRQRGLLAGRT